MGNLYPFKCMNCNYQTECSMGDDRGMNHSYSPFLCTNCEEVKNLITGDAEYRCGPISIPVTPKCKTCGRTDSLVKWDLLTCPKCKRKDMHYLDVSIALD